MSTTYARNYLANVICKADFPLNLRLGNERPVVFQERIAALFPKANEGVTLQGEVPAGIPQNISLKQPVMQWQFFSRDMKNQANLQRDFLSVETQEYVDFENFRELFEAPFQLLCEIYDPPVITRLGLRYCNHLRMTEGDPTDWGGLVVDPLVNHLRFEHGGQLTQDGHTLRFDTGNIHVGFRYGVFNPDYPGPARVRQFMLDIDCFIRDDMESGDVLERLGELNQEATDVFERSIGDGWRDLMRD